MTCINIALLTVLLIYGIVCQYNHYKECTKRRAERLRPALVYLLYVCVCMLFMINQVQVTHFYGCQRPYMFCWWRLYISFFYCLIPMTVTVCKVVFHLTISFCSTDIDDQVVDLFLNMCPNFKVFGPQIFPRRAGNFWPNFCKLYTVQPW